MKFQDSSFHGSKVTEGTKSVTHARTHAHSKSNMPHQLFQSWGHKNLGGGVGRGDQVGWSGWWGWMWMQCWG